MEIDFCCQLGDTIDSCLWGLLVLPCTSWPRSSQLYEMACWIFICNISYKTTLCEVRVLSWTCGIFLIIVATMSYCFPQSQNALILELRGRDVRASFITVQSNPLEKHFLSSLKSWAQWIWKVLVHKDLSIIDWKAQKSFNHNQIKLIRLITWTTALSNSMKLWPWVGSPKTDGS